MTRVAFTVPLRAGGGLNDRLSWQARHKRGKKEASSTMKLVPHLDLAPVVTVTLTRVGPNELDDDNLRGVTKAVRDGVAAKLRVDDSCRLVQWVYAQEKGSPICVRVELEVPTRG